MWLFPDSVNNKAVVNRKLAWSSRLWLWLRLRLTDRLFYIFILFSHLRPCCLWLRLSPGIGNRLRSSLLPGVSCRLWLSLLPGIGCWLWLSLLPRLDRLWPVLLPRPLLLLLLPRIGWWRATIWSTCIIISSTTKTGTLKDLFILAQYQFVAPILVIKKANLEKIWSFL